MSDTTMEQNLPLVLTVQDLASVLGIGKNQAYALIKTGKIPCIRIGKCIRIPQTALLDFLSTAAVLS